MIDGLSRPPVISESILITHRDCLDGCGCSVCFLNAGGKKENIRYIGAGSTEKYIKQDSYGDFSSDRFLVFADIGITSSRLADQLEKRGNVVMIDHHNTSKHLMGRSWCIIDMEHCGTELFRQYLGLDDPGFIGFAETIEDFDLWKRKLQNSDDLSLLQVFMGQEEFVDAFAQVESRMLYGSVKLTPEESDLLLILKRKREESISSLLKRVVMSEDAAVVVSEDENVSTLLNRMLEEHPTAKYSCQINLARNSASLRSRGDCDVSEIALKHGGGGHKAAAGFMLPPGLAKRIIDEVL